jgi:membrane fusion protein (multidrug efflux system)
LNLREGDLAGAGVPIMTVVSPDRLKAVFRVPEREFLRLKQGMVAHVSPLARPEQLVTAKVTLVGPVVDRLSRTGLVEVELDNEHGALPPGAVCRATLEVTRREGALLVPAEAVLLSAETHLTGAATVFVVDGDKARQRTVKLGARQADRLEVTEGLAAGEALITLGAHLLRDGNPIRTAEKAQ